MQLKRTPSYVISFVLTLIILIGIYIMVGVYPFGNAHVIKIDAFHSYAPRVNELFHKLITGESLQYSWRGGLGTDFYLTMITTMLDPFLLSALIFGTSGITETFSLMYLIQIPLISSSFAYYLKVKYAKDDKLAVIFALMYALSSYVTGFFFVYYWQQALMLLPFVAIGIDKLIKSGDIKYYAIALGLGIISNYLMGMFLCMFSVAYFIVEVVSAKASLNVFDNTFIEYGIGSLAALGVAGVVLLPAVVSLGNTSYGAAGTYFPEILRYFFPIPQLLTAALFDMTPSILQHNNTGTPNIYVGLLGFMLTFVFLLNTGISRKRKVVVSLTLFFLLIASTYNQLGFMLNGMRYPAGLPHRFSFIYCFIVLVIGFETVINIKKIKRLPYLAVLAFLFLLIPALWRMYPHEEVPYPGFITNRAVIANMLLIVIYGVIVYMLIKGSEKTTRIMQWLLTLVVITEMSISAGVILSDSKGTQRDLYVLEILDDMQQVSTMLHSEDEFYRAELSPNRLLSDSKLFDYKGMSIFSIAYDSVVDMLSKFGVSANTNKVEYSFATPLINSIMGIKYSINRGYMLASPPIYFRPKAMQGQLLIYENPYALPIGFMTKRDLLDYMPGQMDNAFLEQNEFVTRATGMNYDIFAAEFFPDNLRAEQNMHTTVDFSTGAFTYRAADDIDVDSRLLFDLEYTVPSSNPGFITFDCRDIAGATISFEDGSAIVRSITTKTETIDMGMLNAGEKLLISVELKNHRKRDTDKGEDEEALEIQRSILYLLGFLRKPPASETVQEGEGKITIAQMDEKIFMRVFDELSRESLNVTNYDATSITGTISVQNPGVMFTSIPFDNRWHVYANGEELENFRVMNSLLGVVLEPGEYSIEFVYRPSIIIPISYFISIITILLLFFAPKLKDFYLSRRLHSVVNMSEARDAE